MYESENLFIRFGGFVQKKKSEDLFVNAEDLIVNIIIQGLNCKIHKITNLPLCIRSYGTREGSYMEEQRKKERRREKKGGRRKRKKLGL